MSLVIIPRMDEMKSNKMEQKRKPPARVARVCDEIG
jgi:hypothetical protein